MQRVVGIVLAAAGLAAILMAAIALAADEPKPELKYRAFAPAIAREEATVARPTATPTPRPQPYAGPVQTLYLGSARITNNPVVEQRDTTLSGGVEVFQDPSAPARVAWYSRFGHPGFGGNNSIFAGHINYVGHGNGPFAYLTSAAIGDALYVTMANGEQYAYTVRSVDVIRLADLNMEAIVFPALDSYTERVTLISCGGDFVPHANGIGGEYQSRVVLTADRYVP